MDSKIAVLVILSAFCAFFLYGCDTCTDSNLVTKRHFLPVDLKKSLDSARSVGMHSNKGRNELVGVNRRFCSDCKRWTKEIDSKCRLETCETVDIIYQSQLYDMQFFIGIEVDRHDKTILYLNPDESEDAYKRIVLLDPTNLQDNGICTFHYCNKDISYMRCSLFDVYGDLIDVGDSIVTGNYRFYPDTLIGGKLYKDCIELTFADGRVTGSNAVKKLWFNLSFGIIKFTTRGGEEWSLEL